jgi:hypothetical protein
MPTTVTFGQLEERGPALKLAGATTEAISESGSSAATTASATGLVPFVRICSTVAIRVVIGASPTATSSSMLLPANVPEYFSVTSGDKVAVIAA